MIQAGGRRDEFAACFQAVTQVHVQPEAWDKNSFREFLELISFPLVDAVVRLMFDHVAQHGNPGVKKFAELYPTPLSRDGLFDAMNEEINDPASDGFFPSGPKARLKFQAKLSDAALTVEGASEAIFPA